MSKNKHFTLNERVVIEQSLNERFSFKSIAKTLDKDCTSISKELKKHIVQKKTGSFGRAFNNCIHRFNCSHYYICKNSICRHKYCKYCAKCYTVCPDYKEYICPLLLKPPYVCNGCKKLKECTLKKSIYFAADAQKNYELYRSESRSGITIDENEVLRLDSIISPLIKKGQSLHHICFNNKDNIMHSEKSIYNYVDYNIFSAKNIDLPRKVRYKPRKKHNYFKVDKSCKVNRTYNDFLEFVKQYPDIPIVEIDTVEGVKGGKVLLTIHFTNSNFMLAFLRDFNTSQSVIDIFENLYIQLSPEIFKKLFPIILTDNGSEFSNPSAIEFDEHGNKRTRLFYCNPSAPYQKGAAENNHELIRRIVPKGHSFNSYNQDDIYFMMNHINSYGRNKLNDRSPYEVFSFFNGVEVLEKLGAQLILPNDIFLKPALIKK